MSPVFDEAKYRALREKLEIGEEKYLKTRDNFRIDSSFYAGGAIKYLNKILDIPHTYFNNEVAKASKGIFDIKADSYRTDGIPFVRINNLRDMHIDTQEMVYISSGVNDAWPLSYLLYGDIVLSKTAIPAASIVSVPQCNASQDIIAIQLKKDASINSFFTVAYLNSCYGIALMDNLFTGNIQRHFNLSDCKKRLPIPVFSRLFQGSIESFVKYGIINENQAQEIFYSTEKNLLQEIGFSDYQPTDASITTKSFAVARTSGRLDAEYYQPKYDELFKRLNAFQKSRLGDIVSIKKSIEPGSDAYQETGIPFVRIADFSKYGITPPEIYLDRETYYSEDLFAPKDTILLSTDGSVGIAYKVEEDLDAITSGALLHLTIRDKNFLPDYLTLVLNSVVVKMQAERDAGGSVIQHWKPSEIADVIIPKLPMEIQREIVAKVQESFALRKESKRLLDLAKRAVEVAIEQGEDVAMKLLEEAKNV